MSRMGVELEHLISDEQLVTEDEKPPADDEYCHILVTAGGRETYCGKLVMGEKRCKVYAGEAICPTCSRATCPACAVRSSLNERLEGLA